MYANECMGIYKLMYHVRAEEQRVRKTPPHDVDVAHRPGTRAAADKHPNLSDAAREMAKEMQHLNDPSLNKVCPCASQLTLGSDLLPCIWP